MLARRQFLLSAASIAAVGYTPGLVAAAIKQQWPLPPQHARIPTDVGGLGYHRMDDYAWFQPKDWHAVLRAPDSLDAPIKAVVKAENDYTDAMLAPSQPLQQKLIARMQELDASDAAPLEVRDGDFLYYERKQAGSDHPVYARRPARQARSCARSVGLAAPATAPAWRRCSHFPV